MNRYPRFLEMVGMLDRPSLTLLRTGYGLRYDGEAYADMMLVRDAVDWQLARHDEHHEALAECIASYGQSEKIAANFAEIDDQHLIDLVQSLIDQGRSVTKWRDVAVVAPEHKVIKSVRESVGTQAICAALAGTDIRTWQRWESGERKPHPSQWGAFLLAVGQHPKYKITPH